MFSPEALKAVLDEQGLSYRTNAVSYILTCPLCAKYDKLYIRKADGRFVCWYCQDLNGFRGWAEYALTVLTGLPLDRLRERLHGGSRYGDGQDPYLHLELRDFFGQEAPDGDVEVPPEMCWPPDYYPIDTPEATPGRTYLEGRGVTVDVASRYGLRYAPAERRVVFPIEEGGHLYGWQGRYIRPTEVVTDRRAYDIPKAITTGRVKEGFLGFADRLHGSPHAVVTEGPVDALKADLCGGNVFTMGKAIRPAQLARLARSGCRRVYLGLDRDAAFETAKSMEKLQVDTEVYHLEPPAHRSDLGECEPQEVLAQFQTAPRLTRNRLVVYVKSYWDFLKTKERRGRYTR